VRQDELNRILAAEDEIVPTSGFAAAVMHAVRSEAEAPRPIPFPWRRALPGAIAAVVALTLLMVELFTQSGAGTALSQGGSIGSLAMEPIVDAAMSAGAHWIALALLLTLASVSLSMRLGSRAA
jgi:hypothetical protein